MLSNYPVAAMLRAENIERAKRFYTETLGLSLTVEQGIAFVVEGGSGTSIAVYQRENMPVPQHNVAVWQVEDVSAVAQNLIERGVQPERYEIPGLEFDENGVTVLTGRPTLWFKDSEDNTIMVSAPLV